MAKNTSKKKGLSKTSENVDPDLVSFYDLTSDQIRSEALKMGIDLPKSNSSKSKLIGKWQKAYDKLGHENPLDSLMFDVASPSGSAVGP